jgi:hypothetical protein
VPLLVSRPTQSVRRRSGYIYPSASTNVQAVRDIQKKKGVGIMCAAECAPCLALSKSPDAKFPSQLLGKPPTADYRERLALPCLAFPGIIFKPIEFRIQSRSDEIISSLSTWTTPTLPKKQRKENSVASEWGISCARSRTPPRLEECRATLS